MKAVYVSVCPGTQLISGEVGRFPLESIWVDATLDFALCLLKCLLCHICETKNMGIALSLDHLH